VDADDIAGRLERALAGLEADSWRSVLVTPAETAIRGGRVTVVTNRLKPLGDVLSQQHNASYRLYPLVVYQGCLVVAYEAVSSKPERFEVDTRHFTRKRGLPSLD